METQTATKIKALLVDDDNIARRVHRQILENLNYEVDMAEDGYQAITMANSGNYAFILMDVGLPGISGIEATKEIRSQKSASQHIPIFILTSYSLEETKETCIAAGVNEILLKPLQADRLLQALKRYIKNT
jgi:CheY-like chemotaxis protein